MSDLNRNIFSNNSVDLRELFINTLINYLKSRGRLIYSLLETCSQNSIRIELLGLRRYFRSNARYLKFDELYYDLRRKYGSRLEYGEYTIELQEDYIILPKQLLLKIIQSID